MSFRSFAPRAVGPDDKVYDALSIFMKQAIMLEHAESSGKEIIPKLSHRFSCEITLGGGQDDTWELLREVGFSGRKENVAHARAILEGKLLSISLNSRYLEI